MARKYEVAVGGDTSGFEKAVQNGIVEPLGDAEKAFDKLDRTAKDTELNRELDKAQDATKDLDKQLDVTRRSLDKLGYAAKGAGDDTKRGVTDAKGAIKDMGSEAESTGKEMAASFSEPGDVLDGIQELAANAFAGLGPAGVVAGAAAAIGIGAIVSSFEAAEERRKELEERANDLAQAYIEAGGQVLDALTVADRTADVLTNPEQRKEAEELAKLLGGDLSLAVRALAGDTAALAEVQTLSAAAQERNNETAEQAIGAGGKRKSLLEEERDANQKLIDKTAELTKVQQDAALTAQVQSDVLYDLINATAGASEEVDELGNRLYTLPDGKQIMVDAQTGQATANIDKFKGDVDGVKDEVTVRIGADASQFDATVARVKATKIRVDGQVVYRTADGRQLL